MDERLGCWDEVLGTMPEATLAARRAAFRQLLSGRAIAVEKVAAEASLPIPASAPMAGATVSGANGSCGAVATPGARTRTMRR